MAKVIFGRGSGAMTVATDLEREVREALRRATGVVGDRIEAEAEEIYEDARVRWPVKTGRSKRALESGLRVLDEDLEAYVGNPTDYTYFIRSKALDGGRSKRGAHVWTTLVRKPFQERGDELADELKTDLLDEWEG